MELTKQASKGKEPTKIETQAPARKVKMSFIGRSTLLVSGVNNARIEGSPKQMKAKTEETFNLNRAFSWEIQWGSFENALILL